MSPQLPEVSESIRPRPGEWKVDDLVKAIGADTGISKSEVARIGADLDEQVASMTDRDLSPV